MKNLEDVNKNPPSFPLLVTQARSIALEMIGNVKPLSELDSDTRSKLALLINIFYHDAFWTGIYTQEESKSHEFNQCLESLYDQELQLYWTRFRKAKTPQLLRPVNISQIKIDAQALAKKEIDLKSIREMLVKILPDTSNLDLLMKNLSTIWDVVILDASALSNDYCSTNLRLQAAGKSPDMRALMFPKEGQVPNPYEFESKTAMISEGTFYTLTGLTLLASVGFYYYSRTQK